MVKHEWQHSLLSVIRIRFFWLWCLRTQDESSNTGVPAEGVIPEAPERRGVHSAHVELVIQQVRVPRQTAAAGDRGSRHPSVICAPAVVALRVQFCRHTPPHTQSSQPVWRATPQHRSQVSSLRSGIKLEQAFTKISFRLHPRQNLRQLSATLAARSCPHLPSSTSYTQARQRHPFTHQRYSRARCSHVCSNTPPGRWTRSGDTCHHSDMGLSGTLETHGQHRC